MPPLKNTKLGVQIFLMIGTNGLSATPSSSQLTPESAIPRRMSVSPKAKKVQVPSRHLKSIKVNRGSLSTASLSKSQNAHKAGSKRKWAATSAYCVKSPKTLPVRLHPHRTGHFSKSPDPLISLPSATLSDGRHLADTTEPPTVGRRL